MSGRVVRAPAAAPCGSCPYRRDVASGVWDAEEYEKLPPYDRPTAEQPPSAFLCHQQDGRLCAGWAGCHDMDHNFGLRMLAASDGIADDDLVATLDYTTDVPLFASGQEARDHGLAEVEAPSASAVRTIRRLERKRSRA